MMRFGFEDQPDQEDLITDFAALTDVNQLHYMEQLYEKLKPNAQKDYLPTPSDIRIVSNAPL